MDPSQVERLKDEHNKGLQICEDKITQWEKFKADYEVLKQRLETLPDALSYDITVPFGPNAFTMGKLVHTNELMVLLGDNWFAEVSGKQAVAIADRRIEQCSKMLVDLAKEKTQFLNWLAYIDEVTNENLVEIVEKYDEEEEKKWREQHAKNVKAYRQKLAEKRKHSHSSEESITSNSDDEYIAKLDNLELNDILEQQDSSESEGSSPDIPDQQEIFEAESVISKSINKQSQESEKKSEIKELSEPEIVHSKCNDNHQQDCEEKSKKPSLTLNINCANDQNSLHETESGDDDGSKSDDLNANLENCNAESNGKHVRWQDQSKLNIKKITFKHSKSKLHTHKHHVKKQDSNESDEMHPLIQSPSDIYKHFGTLFQASSPKSILKVKNSPTTPESKESFFHVDEIVPKATSPDMKDENIVNAFTGKVFEHSSPIHIGGKKSSARPVSQFKNSRKNRKR